jgi:hypothetical protein
MKYLTSPTPFFRPVRAVTLLLAGALAGAVFHTPAYADDAELATTSSLTGIKLPSETVRMTDEATIEKLIQPLDEAGKQYGLKVQEREVLAWAEPAKRKAQVKKQITTALTGAGITTQALNEDVPTEAGTMSFFLASKETPKTVYVGYWVDNQDALILNWARMAKAGETAPAEKPAVQQPPAQKPAAKQDAGGLEGKWGFTTISGTTYWDKTTGAYLGSGTGGSQTYTILPGGKYKFFNYIKSRMYGWETQYLTWEEGTVTIQGDKVTFTPDEGKYQVIDNQVAKNNYTRPKTDEELKKAVRTSSWRLTTEDGKPVLIMADKPGADVKYRQQAD